MKEYCLDILNVLALGLIIGALSGCRNETNFPSRQVAHMFVNATADTVILEAGSQQGDRFRASIAPGDSLLDGPHPTTFYRQAFRSRLQENTLRFISLRRASMPDSCFVSSFSTDSRLLLPQGYTTIPRFRPDIESLLLYRITDADFSSLQACP